MRKSSDLRNVAMRRMTIISVPIENGMYAYSLPIIAIMTPATDSSPKIRYRNERVFYFVFLRATKYRMFHNVWCSTRGFIGSSKAKKYHVVLTVIKEMNYFQTSFVFKSNNCRVR